MTRIELPSGWAPATLGELAHYQNGRGFKKSEWSDSGRPIVRIQNLTGSGDVFNYYSGSLDERHTVKTGDLLISWAATLGAFIWNGPEGALNQHIFKATPYIDHKFLYYLVQHALGGLYNHTHGSGMVHITKEKFDNFPVAVPPLREQQRIVATLEEYIANLDLGISRISRTLDILESLRESILSHAVDGKLALPRGGHASNLLAKVFSDRDALTSRSRKPLPPTTVSGYTLPSYWGMASLDEISYDSGYGTSTKCDYPENGSPVLRIPNIQNGEIDLGDIKYAADVNLNLRDLYISPGDLLFVRTNGSPSLIGRVAVVREKADIAFASYLIRFRLVPDGIDPDWVRIVVSSPLWRRHIINSSASSAGQHNVNSKILGSLPIPIPPLEEQQEIIESVRTHLGHAGQLRKASIYSATRADVLRATIMGSAFSGRLVPQDPDDEPASVLLDRIQAEKADKPKVGRVSRTKQKSVATQGDLFS